MLGLGAVLAEAQVAGTKSVMGRLVLLVVAAVETLAESSLWCSDDGFRSRRRAPRWSAAAIDNDHLEVSLHISSSAAGTRGPARIGARSALWHVRPPVSAAATSA